MAKVVALTAALWREHVHQVRVKNCKKLNENRQRAKSSALIEKHMGIVKGIAASCRHMFPSIPFDDLVSCGYVGLCDAAGRYRPDRGAFAPFAYQRIRGAIIDAHKRKAYREELHESLDDNRVGLGDHRFEKDELHGKANQILTIDRKPLQDEILLRQETRRLVEAALILLPEEEAAVLGQVFDGVPMREIAAEFGHSVSWVRARMASGRKRLEEVMELRKAA